MRHLILAAAALTASLISMQAPAAPRPQGSESFECRIITPLGTAMGNGTDMNQAREAARLNCGTTLIEHYFSQRSTASEEIKDDLALACVNLDCQ